MAIYTGSSVTPEPTSLTISDKTFRGVIAAMLDAISEHEGVPSEGSDSALTHALYAALDGDREQVLREVAEVLSPAVIITTAQPGE